MLFRFEEAKIFPGILSAISLLKALFRFQKVPPANCGVQYKILASNLFLEKLSCVT